MGNSLVRHPWGLAGKPLAKKDSEKIAEIRIARLLMSLVFIYFQKKNLQLSREA
jgi:hypothetical protein